MNRIFNNQSGFAIVYGLVVLLLATVGGTSLLYIARKDRAAVSNYAKMRSASLAAQAALKACEGMFREDPGTALQILSAYCEDQNNRCLLNGIDGVTDESIRIKMWEGQKSGLNAPEYCANILAFDETSRLIRIEGLGYGGHGGKKRIVASYELGGFTKNVPNVLTGEQYAIFLGGEGRNFDHTGIINGNVYTKGNLFFNSNAGGFTINGYLKTANSADYSNPSGSNGSLIINGDLLCQTPVKLQGSADMTVYGNAGFQYGTELLNITMDVYGDVYMNGSNNTTNSWINVHGHDFYCRDNSWSEWNDVTGEDGFYDNQGYMNLEEKLGMTTASEECYEVDASLIDGDRILLWEDLGTTLNELFPGDIDPWNFNLCGGLLDEAYDHYQGKGKLWMGYIVIEIPFDHAASMAPTAGFDNTFDGNAIFIVKGEFNVNQNMYSSGPNSVTLIYVTDGGMSWNWPEPRSTINNFGFDGTFRGYINVDSDGLVRYKLKPGTILEGAMHHVTPESGFQSNDGGGTYTINYNNDILNLLAATGVVTMPGEETETVEAVGSYNLVDLKVRATRLGINL